VTDLRDQPGSSAEPFGTSHAVRHPPAGQAATDFRADPPPFFERQVRGVPVTTSDGAQRETPRPGM